MIFSRWARSIAWGLLVCALLPMSRTGWAQRSATPEVGSLNKPERLDWFRDLGFGLFIHWSVDVQTGVGISHSLVGASREYTDWFYNDLPKTFYPREFHPEDWARLAKIAGVRYMMFTNKHHSGFAMYDTATTPFGVMNTPFHRDITAEVFQAFREQKIPIGVYFSPDDFYWLRKEGKPIRRNVPDVQPKNNPGLMAYDQAQVKELLTKYGPIQVIFFDGQTDGLRDLAWKLQPDIVVSRGALQTPEQYIPGMPLKGAWEANLTMGASWMYQPQGDTYKSTRQLLDTLIQTRAKGGNLLLDIGPKANGEIPAEEEDRLREMGLWMSVNSECIYGVRPWVITNEGDKWFTKNKDEDTLYVIDDSPEPWVFGKWRDVLLKSVQTTDQTEVTVLGENGRDLEYQPKVNPMPTWKMESDGLHVHAMLAQRLQDNYKWDYPVVLKLTHVKPGFQPPQVKTGTSRPTGENSYLLSGAVTDMGGSPELQVGFEYRRITADDVAARSAPWVATTTQAIEKAGPYTLEVKDLPPGTYEFHAVVKHPLLTIYGGDVPMH
jgi:alpha-L-fucosidase